MRVKLQGLITAERLAEALDAAQAKFDEVREGCRFFGANLYLTAYAADGGQADLVDHRGESLVITIRVPSGELARPALTGEALKRQDEQKAAAALAKAQEEAAREESRRKHREMLLEMQRKDHEREVAYQAHNTLTAQILRRVPERFIAAMNDIIRAVWDEMKPVEPHGKKKGQPRPMPRFSFKEGTFLLEADSWKSARKILNPFGSRDHYEIIKPYWAHDAWKEVSVRMQTMMNSLMDELNGLKAEDVQAADDA